MSEKEIKNDEVMDAMAEIMGLPAAVLSAKIGIVSGHVVTNVVSVPVSIISGLNTGTKPLQALAGAWGRKISANAKARIESFDSEAAKNGANDRAHKVGSAVKAFGSRVKRVAQPLIDRIPADIRISIENEAASLKAEFAALQPGEEPTDEMLARVQAIYDELNANKGEIITDDEYAQD